MINEGFAKSMKSMERFLIKVNNPLPDVRINSNIDFYIGKKRLKGKVKSNFHEGKYPDTASYIDVAANGKTYLCRFNSEQNKFIAIIN